MVDFHGVFYIIVNYNVEQKVYNRNIREFREKSGRRTRTRDQSPDDENGDCT